MYFGFVYEIICRRGKDTVWSRNGATIGTFEDAKSFDCRKLTQKTVRSLKELWFLECTVWSNFFDSKELEHFKCNCPICWMKLSYVVCSWYPDGWKLTHRTFFWKSLKSTCLTVCVPWLLLYQKKKLIFFPLFSLSLSFPLSFHPFHSSLPLFVSPFSSLFLLFSQPYVTQLKLFFVFLPPNYYEWCVSFHNRPHTLIPSFVIPIILYLRLLLNIVLRGERLIKNKTIITFKKYIYWN